MANSPAITNSVTHFFGRLQAGDRSAAERLWTEFCPRLLALARRTLGNRPAGPTDAEDAVQSAFITFWRRAELGEFAGDLHRNNLWNLLSTITVRKALNNIERENAGKRGGGRVRSASSLADDEGAAFSLDEALASVPAHDFDLHCEELLGILDEEERTIALFKLMCYTNREIATTCGWTERKVERKLQLIRLSWERELAD